MTQLERIITDIKNSSYDELNDATRSLILHYKTLKTDERNAIRTAIESRLDELLNA